MICTPGNEKVRAWQARAEAERLKGVYVVSESGLGWTMQNGTEPSRTTKMGRKRYDVPFAIVCKALHVCCGNYSGAARWIFEETGTKVSPGFVQTRVQRENKTLEDILGQPLQSLAPKSG